MSDLTVNLSRRDVLLLDTILRQRRHNDGLGTALTQVGADRLDPLDRFLSEKARGESIPLDRPVAETAFDVLTLAVDHFSGKRKEEILRLIGELKGRGVTSQMAAAIHANPGDAIAQRFGPMAGVPEAGQVQFAIFPANSPEIPPRGVEQSQSDELKTRLVTAWTSDKNKHGRNEPLPKLALHQARNIYDTSTLGRTKKMAETVLKARAKAMGVAVSEVTVVVAGHGGQIYEALIWAELGAKVIAVDTSWLSTVTFKKNLGKIDSPYHNVKNIQVVGPWLKDLPQGDIVAWCHPSARFNLPFNLKPRRLTQYLKDEGVLIVQSDFVFQFIRPFLSDTDLVAEYDVLLYEPEISRERYFFPGHPLIHGNKTELLIVQRRSPATRKKPQGGGRTVGSTTAQVVSDALLMDQPFVGAAGDVERELDRRTMPSAVQQAVYGGVKLVSGGGGPFVRLVGSDGEGSEAQPDSEKRIKHPRRGKPSQPFFGGVTTLPGSGLTKFALPFFR